MNSIAQDKFRRDTNTILMDVRVLRVLCKEIDLTDFSSSISLLFLFLFYFILLE